MNQNNQKDQKSGQQGVSSSGSNGQMGKQAGGQPSYEDERKTKSQGMSAPGQSSKSTEDVTVAKQGSQPQTTLNTSGVQEGREADKPNIGRQGDRSISQDLDSDEDIDADQDEAQRRTA